MWGRRQGTEQEQGLILLFVFHNSHSHSSASFPVQGSQFTSSTVTTIQFNSGMDAGFQSNVRLRLLVRVAEHLPVVGQPPSVVVHLLVLLGQQQQQVLVLLLQQTQLPV